MRFPRIATIGAITMTIALAVGFAGCIGQVSPPPGSVAASPTPTPTDDPVINSLGFESMTGAQACALLTVAQVSRLLGGPLAGDPQGISNVGDRVDCIYEAVGPPGVGHYVKVEFNRLGFAGEAVQVNLHRTAHTLEVAGFQAIGADAEQSPVNGEAVLCVKLARSDQDPALWIEAPTSVAAKAAAEIILPRLAALP